MRMRGRWREIINPLNGLPEWSPHPRTREESKLEDLVKYWPGTPCPIHGGRPVYYTLTGIAACCAQKDTEREYNAAMARKEPRTSLAAQQQDLDFFWLPQVNPYCGHPGKLTLAGKCYFCAQEKAESPRQVALRNGEAWYMPAPDDPCKNGHIALRRVANGSCKECEDLRRPQGSVTRAKSDELPVYRNPDMANMVISRADAKAMGFVAFRTGKPCHQGHTGWRYVSTGCCIPCKEDW